VHKALAETIFDRVFIFDDTLSSDDGYSCIRSIKSSIIKDIMNDINRIEEHHKNNSK
jgi:hypothetical protein